MKIKNMKSILMIFCILGGCSPNQKTNETVTLKDALRGRFYIGAALNLDQFWGRATADLEISKAVCTGKSKFYEILGEGPNRLLMRLSS